jgi:hypothetical protein
VTLLLSNGSSYQSIGSEISSSNSEGTSKKVSSGSDSRGARLGGISLSDPAPFSSTLSGTGGSRFRDEPVVSISMAAIGLGSGSSGALHLGEDYRQIGPLIKVYLGVSKGTRGGGSEGGSRSCRPNASPQADLGEVLHKFLANTFRLSIQPSGRI